MNERDDASSSPYHTNRLANERARHVFQDIAAMSPAPAFVVHLGDIVHPVPSLPTFSDAVAQFKAIASPLTVPLHLVPGNHDVGDKRVDWMPADQVCSDYLDIYRDAFGADYHAFDRDDRRFIFMNSLLLNSGLPEEEAQRLWLESQMDSAGGKRVFLFMHYPPFIYKENERGNYDNVDEPARSWLVSQMKRSQVEGVFAGHVHNFWYDRTGPAEFYMLPSTAFLRHDFTEFYKVAPGYEFGRGDVEKFGYFVVDVFETGHVAYSIRTMGQQAELGAPAAQMPMRYASPNVVAMLRSGNMAFPLNKVGVTAKALGIDPTYFLTKVLEARNPELLDVLQEILGNKMVTDMEGKLLAFIRKQADGVEFDYTRYPDFIDEVGGAVKKVAEREKALHAASLDAIKRNYKPGPAKKAG